jgi:hypothetical protein
MTIPGRAALAVAAVLVFAAPVSGLRATTAPSDAGSDPRSEMRAHTVPIQDPDRPKAERYSDPEMGLAITPPAGWVMSPLTSLNPVSDPPEPVEETARFQLRVGNSDLYASPIPITSGLVADAVAVISIGVAREGSDILAMDRGVRGSRESGSVPGFTTIEDEATYEGLHVLTRYLFSREGDRVLVVQAAAAENAWAGYADQLRASLATFGGDAKGENAPAPAPPPPAPAPAPAAPAVDASLVVRGAMLQRAASVLGLRYVWGGNSTVNGMDCSAYVSWVWGTSRWSTDSIWNVSFPITKADLRPGDALNLTTGRDPQRLGHIRLFEAWANEQRTAMWVYEETPPRVVHRVIAYDDRYQPIRLMGLSGAGEARVIPGAPAPQRTATPSGTRRPSATYTPRPTRRPTARPTARPSAAAGASSSVRPQTSVPAASTSALPTPLQFIPTPTWAPVMTPTPRPPSSPAPSAKPSGP